LNSIYCAPNKIYEYAAIGLGMILPEYPGMASINHEFNLGVLCDPLDPSSIMQAMKDLLSKNPADYKESARRFMSSSTKPMEAYKDVYQKLEELIKNKKETRRCRKKSDVKTNQINEKRCISCLFVR